MAIKPIDMDAIAAFTGNIYESLTVLSKRSRQVATQEKAELDEKLAYFEGFEQELEDPRFQEEQARVSLAYEVRAEPSEVAIHELLDGDVYYRDSSKEQDI